MSGYKVHVQYAWPANATPFLQRVANAVRCAQVCADTVVGDAMLRGISGGQKKRVTTAEMVVGPTKTLFMDEISTGLVSCFCYSAKVCNP